MNVKLLSTLPAEWKCKKPIQTYETRFVYIGFRRYDTHKKTISGFLHTSDGSVTYQEFPTSETVLSRAYHTECVRVTVYSESPRVWTEELSPYDLFAFVQHPTQTACT
jgi:hypothetical protein